MGQQLNRVEDFKQISTNDGLSHADAINIIQDSDSFLWIGTNSGLNKYDGYTIEKHKWDPSNKKSIPGNRIQRLASTKNKIWMLIQDKGLFCYDLLTLSFHLIIDIPKLAPNSFMFDLDQNENIWFFHKKTGLVTFAANQDISNRNQSNTIDLKKIPFNGNSFRSPELKKMIEIDGNHYFFDSSGAIHIYDKTEKNLTPYVRMNKGQLLTTFSIDNNNTMISCKKGLFIWNPISQKIGKVLFTNSAELNVNNSITSICRNGQTYFLGTEKGLYKGVLNTKNQMEVEEVIPLININALFIDSYNVLWVASSGYGLFYQDLQKLPFGHIRQSKSKHTNNNSLIKSFISAILKEKLNKEELWIGSRNGLSIYNIQTKEYITQIEALRDKHIRYIFQDAENDIWVGTKTEGLFRYRDKKLVEH